MLQLFDNDRLGSLCLIEWRNHSNFGFMRNRNCGRRNNLVRKFPTWLLAWFRPAMTRERFTGQRRTAIPSIGNDVAGYLRDDDVWLNGLGCSRRLIRGRLGRSRFLATGAVLGERFTRQHDSLWRRAVRRWCLLVSGRVVHAVKRGLWSKPTGTRR